MQQLTIEAGVHELILSQGRGIDLCPDSSGLLELPKPNESVGIKHPDGDAPAWQLIQHIREPPEEGAIPPLLSICVWCLKSIIDQKAEVMCGDFTLTAATLPFSSFELPWSQKCLRHLTKNMERCNNNDTPVETAPLPQ